MMGLLITQAGTTDSDRFTNWNHSIKNNRPNRTFKLTKTGASINLIEVMLSRILPWCQVLGSDFTGFAAYARYRLGLRYADAAQSLSDLHRFTGPTPLRTILVRCNNTTQTPSQTSVYVLPLGPSREQNKHCWWLSRHRAGYRDIRAQRSDYGEL
jgi:hypothetical protein